MNFTHPLVGNVAVQHYLQTQLKNGTVPQANLWIGPEQVGKSTFLKNYIFQAYCVAPPDQRPCQRCRHCQMLLHNSHPNLVWLNLIQSGDGLTNYLRSVLADLAHSSLVDGQRLVVLEQADQLTASASSSLLKILEEPGSGVYFFLLSSYPERILPTIRSRCSLILFQLVPVAILTQHWPEAASVVRAAAGLPGVMASLAESATQLNLRQAVDQWLRCLETTQYHQRLQTTPSAGVNIRDRAVLRQAISLLESINRDVVLAKYGLIDQLRYQFVAERLQRLASRVSLYQIMHAVSTLRTASVDVQRSAQPKLLWQHLLLNLYR